MPFYRDTLGLPDGAFSLLRDLIHDRTGLFYDNGKSEMLTDKLSPLVVERGFNSFLDYYYLLRYDAGSGEEWKRVMDALSVQETYFWREIDQVQAMVDVLVPQYFSEYRGEALRIWSAACATGEEPLTVGMALNEKGWFERAPIKIQASDASSAALEKARRGVFRSRSFRNLNPELCDKYFTKEGEVWRVKPQLHARVNWALANLAAESDFASLANSHVIFCRNVFIYFSEKSIRKTLQMFYRLMPSPGYLFVGASESLLRLRTHFEFEELGGAFVYVKR
ncbi:MAG: protein-glutamate O-methyltransferase CheR [Blastocatellia bacterium]